MVFLRFPFQSGVKYVSFESDFVTSQIIHRHIASYLGNADFSLVCNGRTLLRNESVPRDASVLVTFPLPGGKGGFGSMLRAIGAQIEKTTNREACRDLSGRRLRDINEEQRLKKWISKKGEREAEKVARRKARIERLKSKPKHNFNDFEYEKKLSEAPERVDEAINAGLEKKKRPAPEAAASCSGVKPKKQHLWLDDDISGSSDSDPETSNSDSREATNSDSCNESQKPECSSAKDDPKTCLQNLSETSSSSSSSDIPLPEAVGSGPPSKQHSKVETNEDGDSKEGICPPSKDKLNEDSHITANQPAVEVPDTSPVDLLSFSSPAHLESAGLERLKTALAERGLKCGGSLQDRALRLWAVRGLDPHQYPPALLAKKKK